MGEFVLRDIEITLEPESIQRAIDAVKSLNDDLKKALDALVKDLLEQGKEVAKFQLGMYQSVKFAGLRTGELMESIRVEMANGKSGEGYLVAGRPGDSNGKYSYAVYFEFGFGTGTYHQNDNGSLIRSTDEYEYHKSIGNIASGASGRTKNHPSDRDVYRNIEDFGTIETRSGDEFFGWIYKDKRTGHWYVSHGQNPKPFMYKTLMALTKKAESEGGQYIATYVVGGGA